VLPNRRLRVRDSFIAPLREKRGDARCDVVDGLGVGRDRGQVAIALSRREMSFKCFDMSPIRSMRSFATPVAPSCARLVAASASKTEPVQGDRAGQGYA
jgi:hypothetical protein